MTAERLDKITEGQRIAAPIYRRQALKIVNNKQSKPLEVLLASMVVHLTAHIQLIEEKADI